MVSVFVKSIKENEFLGTYNCVAPEPVTNKELTKQIGKALHRPIWPLGVPSFILRMLLGEQAQIVLEGNAVSCKKLIDSGFAFQYPTIKKAIGSLLSQ
jgi:NAD dependent epimerase/dehydratase family enzyme